MKVTLDNVGRIAEARPTEVAVERPRISTFDVRGGQIRGTARHGISRGDRRKSPLWRARPSRHSSRPRLRLIRAWRYDPPAEAPLTFGVTIRFSDSPEQMMFMPGVFHRGCMRVGVIKPPVKIQDVRPVYPQRSARRWREGRSDSRSAKSASTAASRMRVC